MSHRFWVALAVVLTMPVAAQAASAASAHNHAAHAGHAPGAVEHTHQKASAKGLQATFHFNAPHKAEYTCPMHPEEVSAKPATCKKCKMKLAKQTHHIAVQLADAQKKPVQGATVRLVIQDAHGMKQGLTLNGNGYYEGAFHLMPGAQKLTAYVLQKGAKEAVELRVPYEVK
jgi:hypothetical protein